MKNSLKIFGLSCWRILTEVPGWPDAPRKLRVRRVLPIAVPVAAMVVLFSWNLLWTHPRIQTVRTAHQPIIALEQEVAELKLACSDLHASEVATQVAEVGRMLLTEPKDLEPALDRLKETAHAHGWDATFHAMTGSLPTPPPEAQMYFIPARGKLVPLAENVQPFPTLLACLEQFSTSDKWIDLMHLTLRADEQGRHSVEVNLRAGCRISHEKTPE